MDAPRPDLLDDLARVYARAAMDAFLAEQFGRNEMARNDVVNTSAKTVPPAGGQRSPE
jgi:hypothetical protein